MPANLLRVISVVSCVICLATSLAHAGCSVVDNAFSSEGGGCEDLVTGLVWSSDVIGPLGFFRLWFSEADDICYEFGNGTDTDGDGVVDVTYPEAQGFTDWRAPTVREVLTSLDNGLATHLDYQYEAGAQGPGNKYRFTQCTNRIPKYPPRFRAGYAIRHSDGDSIFVQELADYPGPDSHLCVRGTQPNLAQDCPDGNGNLPSEDGGSGGGGKGNGKGKNAMLLPRSATGSLLILPAAVIGGFGLLRRRS